jgi:hypothetical protein
MDEQVITLNACDGMTVTTTLREWQQFVDMQIKLYDAQILRLQTAEMKRIKRREKEDGH